MKVVVLQEDLGKALAIAIRFTSPKVQLPILSNICLKATKNSLLLCATNLEISVCLSIGADVKEEGEVTIPARTITDIILNLPKGQITLTNEVDVLHISSKGFSSLVTGMSANDFPAVPKELGGNVLTLPSRDFTGTLSSVLFSVSLDESRPILTGVLCILEEKSISLVATDGFRLSRKTVSVDTKQDSRIIIPKGVLTEIVRLKDESSELSLSYTKEENQLVCKIGNAIISSRLIDGDFPNFAKIIPKETTIQVTLAKSEFLKALKIAGIFAKDSANVVKLKIADDGSGGDPRFVVLAESAQKGNQEMVIAADIKRESKESSQKEFVIMFNVTFLEDFVNEVKGDELVIGVNDPSSPSVFTDLGDPEFLHIIMPIRM